MIQQEAHTVIANLQPAALLETAITNTSSSLNIDITTFANVAIVT